jgi:TatD DNase family protein
MLKGEKGRALAREMPPGRVILETDGPFTQIAKSTLSPWDVGLARPALAEIWGVDEDIVEDRIRRNELSLFGLLN